MATGYRVSIEIVSPFVAYSEEQLKLIIYDILENWKNEVTGLGFDINKDNISVVKTF